MAAPLFTARLGLRPLEAHDPPRLFAFLSNAQAMQHTYIATSLAECTRRLQTYEAQRSQHGFAPWVIEARASGDVIGWGGLSIDPDEPHWGPEVSYAFSPAVWGQGLATELVMASRDHAFARLGLGELRAFARPENQASVRVLTKCGFQRLRFEPSLQRDHFRIAAAPGPQTGASA
jgi:RimJ/RimL family protein N-acetyltransferase